MRPAHCVMPRPTATSTLSRLSHLSSSRTYATRHLRRTTSQTTHPTNPSLRTNVPNLRALSTTTTRTMASDDAYMAFLNKANADLDKGRAEQSATETGLDTKTVDADEQIPASLSDVEMYYVSETDEPFEPVVLRWEGAREGVWPGQGMPLSPLVFILGRSEG